MISNIIASCTVISAPLLLFPFIKSIESRHLSHLCWTKGPRRSRLVDARQAVLHVVVTKDICHVMVS